ncbi:MAG: BglG family transcription antiterminator [Treponema sp.]|nr:BglG family transcription antiterminator [Treponema sp.]
MKQLLLLILDSGAPAPAQDLATRLQISKRTVFRELEGLGAMLATYGLRLETKSKKGVSLSGARSDKDALLRMLDGLEFSAPQSIKERRGRLILELLRQKEPAKILWFSTLLKVSESTTNHDLDSSEQWFSKSGVGLVRKPGIGVFLSYDEEDYRKACMRYAHENMNESLSLLYDLVPRALVDKVSEAVKQTGNKKLNEMADFSRTGLIAFLSIAVHRILMGKHVSQNHSLCADAQDSEDWLFALDITEALQRRFGIAYTPAEIFRLFVYIKGARLQYDERASQSEAHLDLWETAREMIHAYDPSAAFDLKNDGEFMDGLTLHLKSAIVRLQSGNEIFNQFQNEVLALYPEVYAKTKKAALALERALDCAVPDDEVGLLALHFCGASMRLKSGAAFARKVKVGIVCSSGIGFSTLLSSRLSSVFGERIIAKCLSQSEFEQNGAAGLDLIVSTIDLPLAENGYLRIHPMLSEDDIANIFAKIAELAPESALSESGAGAGLIEQAEKIRALATEICSLLGAFRMYYVDDHIAFDELLREVGGFIGENDLQREKITEALAKREALSTQVIPEYGIVLLHAKTEHARESIFAIVRAKGGAFREGRLGGIKSAVVMLVPEGAPSRYLGASAISAEIFGGGVFLELLRTGDEGSVKRHLEKTLRRHLSENINIF